MKISGQRRGFVRSILLAGLLGTVLTLAGCGYTLVSTEDLLQLNTVPLEEPEEELEEEVETDPTQEERLKNQLLAVLNLGNDNFVESSSSLDAAASFFMDLILESEKNLSAIQNALNKQQNMQDGMTAAFVYDGQLSSAQVGSRVLTALPKMEEERGYGETMNLTGISVTYGIRGERSAWLILAQWGM